MTAYLGKIGILFSILALTINMSLVHAGPLEEVQEMMAQEKYNAAISRLDELIEEQPENADAIFLRGVIYAQIGDQKEAITIFNTMTERFPELAEPYNNLAVLHAAQGDYEIARKALLEAVEIQPAYATAYGNMGDVYAKLAAIAYDRAYSLNPGNQRVRLKSESLKNMLNIGTIRPGDTAVTETAMTADSPARAAPPAALREVDLKGDAGDQADPPPEPLAAMSREPAPTRAGQCFTIGPLAEDETATRMEDWLRKHGASVNRRSEEKHAIVNHKVYLPPQGNRSQARRLLAELKRKGLKDVLIIPDGELKNGISVGVFARPESIQRRTAQLTALGYETQLQPRYETRNLKRLEVVQTQKHKLDRGRFSALFPDYGFTATACEH